MSFNLRKRTRILGCLLPGIRSSSTTGGKIKGRRPGDDKEDDCFTSSHCLIDDNAEPESKAYNLSANVEEPGDQLPPLKDVSCKQTMASSLKPAMTYSDSGSGSTCQEMTQSFADLELDGQASITSTMTPSSLKSVSAPNSPYASAQSLSSWGSPQSIHTAPYMPNTRSHLPLTTPLPRRSLHRRAHSESHLLPMNMSLPPPLSKQVESTMTLLKSIKQQIRALKRSESHLSTTLGVQRRERLQMREQIAQLEARRLRVEAMFLRPLPLVLLLPVAFSVDDEYDLCLVTEGHDMWNALQPLIRIQLARGSFRCTKPSWAGALLLHFGPTFTQPMAVAVSFVQLDLTEIPYLDLQSVTKQKDFSFWERTTSGQVFEAYANQLGSESCQILFDILMEHKQAWKSQLSQVVDKKTRRIQWILLQEADSLYYDAIPS